MATSSAITSSFLSASAPAAAATHSLTHQFVSFGDAKTQIPSSKRLVNFKVQAAKLPAGVELPKAEPKLQPPFWGFTRNAEIWNSRACMIGLIGTFIVELILNKGILQIIGVEVGKGLDLPL